MTLIRERGTVQAAAVLYVMPIVSIVLDWLFLGKIVKITDLIGVGVIFTGVWLTQKGPKQVISS